MEVTGRRALSIFAAMLLLAVVAGILHEIAPKPEDRSLVCSLADASRDSRVMTEVRARRLEVVASATSVTAQLQAELPEPSQLLFRLQQVVWKTGISRRTELAHLVSACFADASVAGVAFDFEHLTFERPQPDGFVIVTLRSRPVLLADLDAPQWATIEVRRGWEAAAADSSVEVKVKVEVEAASILPGRNWPTLLTRTTAEWTNALTPTDGPLQFMIALSSAAERGERRNTFKELLQGLPWSLHAVFAELVAAAPFILILTAALRTRLDRQPAWEAAISVAVCMLAFHVSCMIADAMVDFAAAANAIERRSKLSWSVGFWDGADSASAVVFFCVLPVLLYRTTQSLHDRQQLRAFGGASHPKALTLAIATVLAVTTCVVTYYAAGDAMWRYRYLEPAQLADQWLSWSLLEATILVTALWLAFEILPRVRPILLGVSIAFGINLVVLGLKLTRDAQLLETGMVAALAIPFALCAINLFRSAMLKVSSNPWRVLSTRWFRLGLVLACIGLVIMLAEPRVENEVLESRLRNVLYPFATLGVFCVLAVVLVVARTLGENEDEQPDMSSARALSALLLLGFVIWPSRNVPAFLGALLVAGILLRYWTFRTPIARSGSADALRLAVRAAVSRALADEGLRALRKAKVTELSEGKISFRESNAKFAALEAEIEGDATRIERELRSGFAALEWGPDPRAWNRGLLGAKYGAIVGLPWSILFIVSSLQQPLVGSGLDGVVAFVFSVIFSVIQWALVGLVLMYSFPFIRGNAGLQKGLVLFVSIAVPVLSGVLLSSGFGDAELPKHFLWVCQLFAVCMMLGLFAGDYKVLRGVGLGWRQLIDLHQLGSMAAWGSSLLVALGAAVAAGVSTEAVGWLAEGMRLFSTEPSVSQVANPR